MSQIQFTPKITINGSTSNEPFVKFTQNENWTSSNFCLHVNNGYTNLNGIIINGALNTSDTFYTSNNNISMSFNVTGDNNIIFKTNNLERLRILNNGNINIGTTINSGNYKLNINGSLNSTAIFKNNLELNDIYLLITSNYWLLNNTTRTLYTDPSSNISNIGIGNTNPYGYLHIGSPNISGSDGNIVLSKNNSDTNANNNFKIGYDSDFNFKMGNLDSITKNWKSQFLINNSAPINSFIISSSGNIGINTSLTDTFKVNILGSLNASSITTEMGSNINNLNYNNITINRPNLDNLNNWIYNADEKFIYNRLVSGGGANIGIGFTTPVIIQNANLSTFTPRLNVNGIINSTSYFVGGRNISDIYLSSEQASRTYLPTTIFNSCNFWLKQRESAFTSTILLNEENVNNTVQLGIDNIDKINSVYLNVYGRIKAKYFDGDGSLLEKIKYVNITGVPAFLTIQDAADNYYNKNYIDINYLANIINTTDKRYATATEIATVRTQIANIYTNLPSDTIAAIITELGAKNQLSVYHSNILNLPYKFNGSNIGINANASININNVLTVGGAIIASNINSMGTIYESNISLSNIYISSNNYHESISYYDKILDRIRSQLTEEKQYPPQSESIFNDQYSNIVSTSPSGNGLYIMQSSTSLLNTKTTDIKISETSPASNLFNYNNAAEPWIISANYQYNQNSPYNYPINTDVITKITSNTIDYSFYGHWILLYYSQKFIATKLDIIVKSTDDNNLKNAPKKFYLIATNLDAALQPTFASYNTNNKIEWETILNNYEILNSSYLIYDTPNKLYKCTILIPTNVKAYKYYKLIITEVSELSILHIQQLIFYGIETKKQWLHSGNNLYSSSNISIGTINELSPYLLNVNGYIYSSSNIYANSNIGIGNTIPLGNLHIGNPNIKSDGTLIISKNDNINNRNFKFGYDSDFNFVFGDFGTNNIATRTWNKQFYIHSNASINSLMINAYGNIGINTNNTTLDEKLFLNGNLRITGPINQTDINVINKFNSDIYASNNIFISSNLNVSNIFTSNINVSNYITVNGIIHATKYIGIGTSANLNASLNIQSLANNIGIWNACSTLNTTQKISSFIGKDIDNNNGFYNYYYHNNNNFITNYLSWTTTLNTPNNDILCLTANKNVGIGITNPEGIFQIGNGGKFKISPNDNSYALIGLLDVDSSDNTKIRLQGGTKRIEYYAATGGHIFYTTNSTERFRINNSGNISIGNTSDIYKVNINGSLYSSNDIYALSNIGIGNTTPLGNLHIASPLTNCDGTLIISKNDDINNRNFKFGYDSDFNFVFGDFGTNDIATRTWNKQFYINSNAPQHSLLINTLGNIGIGNSIPYGNLHIGNPNINCDATLIMSKNDNINNRNFKFGYDSDFNFVFGDFGTNDTETRTWNKQFYIHSNASNNSLTINSNGNIGIGTTSAFDQKLYVNGNTTINDGIITQVSTSGNPNIFTNAILINTINNTNYRLNVNGHVNVEANLNTSNLNVNYTAYFNRKVRFGSIPASGSFEDGYNIFIDYNTCINKSFLCRNGDFTHSNGIFNIDSTSLNVKNNALFTGNVGINTEPISINNILQVGDGGRLRISNGTTDYTVIGTDNGLISTTNTRIIINGNNKIGDNINKGNIEYYATNTGKHLFYKNGTSNIASELMRIDSATGNVGIGVTSVANYKLNVLDNINVSGIGKINCLSLISSNSINVGVDPTDKTKTLNVYGSIFGTSNITIASNIITSNINSSTINNNGSFSNVGNLFITGNISQSGTYAFGGTTFNIGSTSDTSKSMIVGGNFTATTNIIAYSNIETTTLKSLFSSNTSNLYTCNLIISGTATFNSNIIQNNSCPISLTGELTLNSSTLNDQIIINNTAIDKYAKIKFTNNIASDGYIGIGGTNVITNGNYNNNFFIQSKTNIILNSGNNSTLSTPSFLITSSGNIGISTAIANNILQINDGGRLRIANGNTDYTVIGTNNGITSATNTRIIINGNNKLNDNNNKGNVEYYTTATGKHIFYGDGTSNNANELVRIDNIGNVGIGTTATTNFKLNVNGQLNISNLIRENGDYLSNIYVKLDNLSNLSINNFNLKKKFGYTCRIDQNFPNPNQLTYNSTIYWKYNIDLRLNTKNLVSTIGENSVCFRSFNIKCFLADCGFETFNINVPNILQYDIYMSSNPINQACLPAIASPKSGLNICAIGTPENYKLNNILPTYITLLRNDNTTGVADGTGIIKNSFDYLSLVSPCSNLAVSYIIEDYLS
jgi:hypothetical protein